MPIAEAKALAEGRIAVFYHHKVRRRGRGFVHRWGDRGALV